MSRGARKAKEDKRFSSVVETAHESLLPKALDEGDYEKAEHVSDVGIIGPYSLIPHKEITKRKRNEGRIQARGMGLAAEANVAHGLSLARKEARYTQAEAAAFAGISELTLRRYETGMTTPDIRTLVTLATLYGTHLERLLGIINSDEEALLDAYEYSTPTAKQTIVRIVEGVQAGRSPEARSFAEEDSKALLEQHVRQLEQRIQAEEAYLRDVIEQGKNDSGVYERYTEVLIGQYESEQLRETFERLREEGANPITDEELDERIDALDEMKERLSQMKERLGKMADDA